MLLDRLIYMEQIFKLLDDESGKTLAEFRAGRVPAGEIIEIGSERYRVTTDLPINEIVGISGFVRMISKIIAKKEADLGSQDSQRVTESQ